MATAPLPVPRSDAESDGRVGIIDIGSNSIRLVVFDGLTRSPISLYNEKVLCGLARSLNRSGKLDPAGTKLARRTIERFAVLARTMELVRLDVLATAAVRDASDGPDFIRTLESQLGLRVRLLSGEEEAKLVGLSVATGFLDADGVVGDLGGGSLELVEVRGNAVGRNATLPLGALRLARHGSSKDSELVARIDQAIEAVDWLPELRDRTFYPVGGAWRALARVDIAQRNYPLRVVDHYAMTRSHAEGLISVLRRMGPESIQKTRAVGQRRVETLPVASILLERVLRIGQPRRLQFSASGLREGHLMSLLTDSERDLDPLIAGSRMIGDRMSRYPGSGEALFEWTAPLFKGESAADTRLRHAACLLSDIAWREHPDYRAATGLHNGQELSVSGVDHRGRCLIGLALYFRYGAALRAELPDAPRAILGGDDVATAQRLGLAMRLGMAIGGGTGDVLSRSAFSVKKKALVLNFEAAIRPLVGEVVEKRLKALAEHMGVSAKLSESDRRLRPSGSA